MKNLIGVLCLLATLQAFAQDTCKNRGELDTPYCDEDGDLLADAPKDPKKLKDPDTIFFTNSPLDDIGAFKKLMQPFVDHLAQVHGEEGALLRRLFQRRGDRGACAPGA
jgi:phosphonate transport system substrate-binding protein